MKDKISLPLSFLINTEVAENELLKRNQSQRLLVIGKSDNARGTLHGVYRTVDEVKAHYGVEASEYRIASHYFNQVEGGELVIASADYNSIDRPVEIEPPVVVEPEPEDDTDFKREYMSLGYEPLDIDIEIIEPEPEEEPEEEPEPISCLSSRIEFNSIDKSIIDLNKQLSIYNVVEIEGVDYAIASEHLSARELLKEVNEKGVGYVSNRLIANTLKELLKRYPSKATSLYNRTNFAIAEYDYAKELSGIDEINKPALIEQITSAGGKAEEFDKSESVIRFKSLTADDLASRRRGENVAVDFMSLFNKGKQAVINSCLYFKYKKPDKVIDTVCKATAVDIYRFAERYTANAANAMSEIKIVLRIKIGGNEKTVSSKVKTSELHNLIAERGISHTANEILAKLILIAVEEDNAVAEVFYEQTNFGIASFDYSRELSGIDSENMAAYVEAVSEQGGKVSNFENNASFIRLSPVAGYNLSSYDERGAIAVNFTDLFETDEIVVAGCLSFDYTPIKRKEPIIGTPEEPEEPEEPELPYNPEAVVVELTPDVVDEAIGADGADMMMNIGLFNGSDDDSGGYNGEYEVYVNGILAADQDEVYEPDLVSIEYNPGLSIQPHFYTKKDAEKGDMLSQTTIVEIVSDAYSTRILGGCLRFNGMNGSVEALGDTHIQQLPSRESNKHIKLSTIPASMPFAADTAERYHITDNLPQNITDLSGFLKGATYVKDINWDVSNVTSFKNAFSSAHFDCMAFAGSSIKAGADMTDMFAYNSVFNQPLMWTGMDSVIVTRMLNPANAFNQPLDMFDSSTWTLSDFESFFGGVLMSDAFNQDLSHWSTASTPDVYEYASDDYFIVINLANSMPQWTAPKMRFGQLTMMGDVFEENFTPDYQ